jgi:anti-sigma B factor antagonist
MEIKKTLNGSELTVALSGSLDTMTVTELEKELKGSLDGVNEIIFDLADLEYISSAGLRVLLKAQKYMNAHEGGMKVLNPSELVMEVFNVTGFSDILTIE